ncbi:hypothetical protein [Nocardiopsis ganjiahuensis]|uniref:hypothetical protein n=1 Tax=Nocardiopsis ganjiahuensis TaxID=239984 RepID=UPI001360B51A|nr:hypothetical protein [Nocardiopsis ganjiahuensis]
MVGTASTALLLLLGTGTLILRLTVGWPRFPARYLGRRRERRTGQHGGGGPGAL